MPAPSELAEGKGFEPLNAFDVSRFQVPVPCLSLPMIVYRYCYLISEFQA